MAEVLESVILHLLRPEVRMPATIAAYLTRALYNRLTDAERARRVRTVKEQDAVDWSDPALDRAVTSVASRHAVTACAPTDTAVGPLPPALEGLAQALVQALTEDERLLIGWEGSLVPHRTIAAWLGISRAAVTKRIWRLRTRLRETATQHASSLPPPEQKELERFFQRSLRETPAKGRVGVAAERTRSPYRTGDRTNASGTMEEQRDE